VSSELRNRTPVWLFLTRPCEAGAMPHCVRVRRALTKSSFLRRSYSRARRVRRSGELQKHGPGERAIDEPAFRRFGLRCIGE
jgi:hypothetical protein